MTVYVNVVMVLNFLVDFLLLLGTNRFCGYPPTWSRTVLASSMGGVYGGICLLPKFSFLGGGLWRLGSLFFVSWMAFGTSLSGLRRCLIFVLLNLALGGLAFGVGDGGILTLLTSACAIVLICTMGSLNTIDKTLYVPVELTYKGVRVCITALRDTGNTLRDPITGGSVLVVEASVAQQLTGLTREQLSNPVATMTELALPGLRLIPYRSIGQPSGMLLGLHMDRVRIGKRRGGSLVAFSPDRLSREGAYQGLTGGTV